MAGGLGHAWCVNRNGGFGPLSTERDMSEKHFGRPIPDSVAIVAMGKSRIDYGSHACAVGGWRGVADEVWAVNKMGGVIFNDICFRMDDLKHNTDRLYPEMVRWLKEHPLVMTSTAYPEYPGSVEYPLEEVVNFVGFPYLNTTPAYALAYALYIGVKEIMLYGCDYTYPDQPMAERGRGCMEMLMGMAFVKGVTLKHGPNTSLLDYCYPLNDRLYGYNDTLSADVVDGKWKITRSPAPETVSEKDAGVGG